MMTTHTVVYEIPGGTRTITREVYELLPRILGTETTETRVWRGYAGWHWRKAITDTRHFRTRAEASEWIDDMFRQKELADVAASGGTKLVILS